MRLWQGLKPSQMEKIKEYFSRKFILTAGSLLAVFLLSFCNRDVAKLEVLVPAILAFYFGSNVGQDWVTKRISNKVTKNGTDNSTSSDDLSGQ